MATALKTSLEEHSSVEKRQAFADRVVESLNAAGLTLMTSIGHRTGLFDVMAKMPPATSRQIADRAGLHERYVREWLGAMVTARVVEHHPSARTYHLPPEHASLLTREGAPENLASMTQWIAVLGQVEDRIVECFRRGGGVHYSSYARFHQVMAEESAQTVVTVLVERILPLVPNLTGALRDGIDVLDIGCGAGRAMHLMAEEFPNSRFTGFDLCDDAIAMARAEADQRGLDNVRFEVRDVATLGQSEEYDLVTAFDAIHDQAEPDRVLAEIRRALRPEGTFLMQDIAASTHLEKNHDHPIGTFLYTISCMHCMTVSLARDGAGLGTCWGEELARQMLHDAGFPRVKVHRLEHDFLNCYYVAGK